MLFGTLQMWVSASFVCGAVLSTCCKYLYMAAFKLTWSSCRCATLLRGLDGWWKSKKIKQMGWWTEVMWPLDSPPPSLHISYCQTLTVIPKLREYSVVDSSSIRVLLSQLYLNITTRRQTQPFTACSLIQHSSVFFISLFFLKKGDTLFQLTLRLEKRIRKTKCCPFSKCPMEKNKKALQYHSMFVHWGGSVDLWWSETLNASTPVCMTQCKHVQDHTPVREMSIVDYLRFNHMKAFLMRVDRETWQSYISLRP